MSVKLNEAIRRTALESGVYLLALPENIHEGFSNVTCQLTDGHYGIAPAPEVTDKTISQQISYLEAKRRGLVTSSFSQDLWERCSRIVVDQRDKSLAEHFEFYNGHLARLRGAEIKPGRSPFESALEVSVGTTSYFTALGTNLFYTGYSYLSGQKEPPLTDYSLWAGRGWRPALSRSRLADALAIHLMLYTDTSIFYVLRGRVGKSAGLFSSTVNGVVERADFDSPGDPLEAAIVREAQLELRIDLPRDRIRWLGIGAKTTNCQCAVFACCKIDLGQRELRKNALGAVESREIADEGARRNPLKRSKYIRQLHRKNIMEVSSLDVGPWSLPYLKKWAFRSGLRATLREKIIECAEYSHAFFGRRAIGRWHPMGACCLLLALAHISQEKPLIHALEEEKVK